MILLSGLSRDNGYKDCTNFSVNTVKYGIICVLSVNGSLASYQIIPLSNEEYEATLRGGEEKRKDIPALIRIRKTNEKWEADPVHEKITPALINAIATQ